MGDFNSPKSCLRKPIFVFFLLLDSACERLSASLQETEHKWKLEQKVCCLWASKDLDDLITTSQMCDEMTAEVSSLERENSRLRVGFQGEIFRVDACLLGSDWRRWWRLLTMIRSGKRL